MIAPLKLSHPPTHQFWEVPVLYEDDQVLAVGKPGDLAASPQRDDPEGPSLTRLLHAAIQGRAPWTLPRQWTLVSLAHRVDPEMSGVLLLAKNRAALAHLANQFGSETVHVVCLALAEGECAADEFTVDLRLAPDAARPGLWRGAPHGGRRSLTRFAVLERFRGYTLLRCEPLTHRVHQIRVHLRGQRLVVAGDPAYGGGWLLLSRLKPNYRFKRDRDELPLIRRPALHLTEITMQHPGTEQPLTVSSPWPKDLTVALKYLRRYAPAR